MSIERESLGMAFLLNWSVGSGMDMSAAKAHVEIDRAQRTVSKDFREFLVRDDSEAIGHDWVVSSSVVIHENFDVRHCYSIRLSL